MKPFTLIFAFFALIGCQTTNNGATSSYWTDVATANPINGQRPVNLDIEEFNKLAPGSDEIAIPIPEGGYINIQIKKSSTMSPALEEKYPDIKSYVVIQSGNIISGRIDINPSGFYAMITTTENTFFINPITKGSKSYLCYEKRNAKGDMNNPFIDKVLKNENQ
ncbi:MAG TPA: hypothetical protein PKL31_17570 [Fulvivirga sp.]|nr:hypothetical protein [Fulvivirga sp.]